MTHEGHELTDRWEASDQSPLPVPLTFSLSVCLSPSSCGCGLLYLTQCSSADRMAVFPINISPWMCLSWVGSLNQTDSCSHILERKFLCMAQSPPIVPLTWMLFPWRLTAAFLAEPRHCWRAWLATGIRQTQPSSRLLLCAAMIQAERHFNRPRSEPWGQLWRTSASLWAPWLSDTECMRSPTPLGSYTYPVQSFSFQPASPFLCLSSWEDERQPLRLPK